MSLPRELTCISNLELAFDRLERSQRKDYKEYAKHLYQAFRITRIANLKHISEELQSGTYIPSAPRLAFLPKKSGILRPITILCVKDAIVYQALANYMSNFFRQEQSYLANKKCFGAILGSSRGKFFFRSWRRNYTKFNEGVTASFAEGNIWTADFDLVAFYELIDHHLLANILIKKVKNQSSINLLTKCLDKWNLRKTGASLHHGIPQGPDASAFFAESILFKFDRVEFKDVKYFRYIDDIKLMSHNESDLRRALRNLDLLTKDYGLVPQAQKIEIRKAENKSQIIKNVPSDLLRVENLYGKKRTTQQNKLILKKLRESIKSIKGNLLITSDTIFKYSLLRTPARVDILKRIRPLLILRPDLSWVLASYLRRFMGRSIGREVLIEAICHDPIYDRAAADYIEALDYLSSQELSKETRELIAEARHRCPESGVSLKVAAGVYIGRRTSKAGACLIVKQERDSLAKSLLLQGLFLKDSPKVSHNAKDAKFLLESIIEKTKDEDLARYCLSHLLKMGWKPSLAGSYPLSVQVSLMELGLLRRKRTNSFAEIIRWFFLNQGHISIPVRWSKVLSLSSLKNATQRSLRMLELADPGAKVMLLDTFNEVLIQEISKKHPSLTVAYQSAAQNNKKLACKHPDFGNWLNNGTFKLFFVNGASIFLEIHGARLESDLAHGRHKVGTGPNAQVRLTKPISFERADALLRKCRIAWAELLSAFQSLS